MHRSVVILIYLELVILIYVEFMILIYVELLESITCLFNRANKFGYRIMFLLFRLLYVNTNDFLHEKEGKIAVYS